MVSYDFKVFITRYRFHSLDPGVDPGFIHSIQEPIQQSIIHRRYRLRVAERERDREIAARFKYPAGR